MKQMENPRICAWSDSLIDHEEAIMVITMDGRSFLVKKEGYDPAKRQRLNDCQVIKQI